MNGASSGVLAALAGVVMVPVVLVLAMSGDKPPSVCGAPTAIGGELPDGGTYTDDMAGNAQAIVETGIALGVPPRGQVIALATALVESDLRNLSYGDRDSVGLFQQRPSQGWGTVAELTTPTVAASKFYEVLVTISDWQTRNPGVVAQSVQRSAFPDRYGQRMTQAASVYAQVTGADPAQAIADTSDDQREGGVAAAVNNCEAGEATGNIVAVPTPAGGTIQVDQSLEGPLTALLTDAAANGIVLGGSGWRDPASQVRLRTTNGCPDVYTAPASSCRVPTARPGTSQHEVGLAIDFAYQGQTICFPRSAANCSGNAGFNWLITNAERYGLKNLGTEAWHFSTSGA